MPDAVAKLAVQVARDVTELEQDVRLALETGRKLAGSHERLRDQLIEVRRHLEDHGQIMALQNAALERILAKLSTPK